MLNANKDFQQRIKVELQKSNMDEEGKRLDEIAKKIGLEAERKRFLAQKQQRMENKYKNWVQKRQEEGKDYSREVFMKIMKYSIQEQKSFERIYKEVSRKIDRSNHNTDEQVIMDKVKELHKQWRRSNETYLKMAEDIEEFRYVSDISPEEKQNYSMFVYTNNLNEDKQR